MTKILITGANSFVGTNFRHFSRFPEVEEVSLIDKKPENIDFSKFDVILHVAAIVHQSKNIPQSEYLSVNRDLCLKVAEYAKKAGVKQFIFLSTLKVYGVATNSTELRNEDSKCNPDDAYGISKYEAEIGLKKYNDSHFTVSIVRPPLVYGEGVKANMLSMVKLVQSFPFLPFRDVGNRRNFIYIENLVGFIDRIIEMRKSGVFIAKDDCAISTTELVYYLCDSLGRRVVLFKMPRLLQSIGAYFAHGIFTSLYGSFEFDNSRTKKELNYSPSYSTEEGVKKWIKAMSTKA